jgi:HTH-type transcriptional regulator/antitoxin HigA
MMATRTKRGERQNLYLKLVARFPLRPIRSDQELDQAIHVVDSLIDRERLRRKETDYLDILSDLVERYEIEHYPIPPLSDGEIIEHLLETKAVSQAEVARATGIAESTISEVIAGKRKLNRTHIGKISHYFGVQPAAFSFDI